METSTFTVSDRPSLLKHLTGVHHGINQPSLLGSSRVSSWIVITAPRLRFSSPSERNLLLFWLIESKETRPPLRWELWVGCSSWVLLALRLKQAYCLCFQWGTLKKKNPIRKKHLKGLDGLQLKETLCCLFSVKMERCHASISSHCVEVLLVFRWQTLVLIRFTRTHSRRSTRSQFLASKQQLQQKPENGQTETISIKTGSTSAPF